MQALINKNGMRKYSQEFTASFADAINNYEIYEQLGDGYFHSFILKSIRTNMLDLVWSPFLVVCNLLMEISRIKLRYKLY